MGTWHSRNMIALTRRELVERTGNNPYVVMMAGGPEAPIYRRREAYVWLAEGPWGPVVASLGAAGEVLPILADLQVAGSLGWTSWTHLPRTSAEAIAEHVTAVVQDDWDFLWTREVPPHIPGEDRVV